MGAKRAQHIHYSMRRGKMQANFAAAGAILCFSQRRMSFYVKHSVLQTPLRHDKI